MDTPFQLVRRFHEGILKPYGHQDYPFKARMGLLLVLLECLVPLTALLLGSTLVQGTAPLDLYVLGTLELVYFGCGWLVSRGKGRVAGTVLVVALTALILLGHFDITLPSIKVDPLLVMRLGFYCVLNLTVVLLVDDRPGVLAGVGAVYLSAGVFQLVVVQLPDPAVEGALLFHPYAAYFLVVTLVVLLLVQIQRITRQSVNITRDSNEQITTLSARNEVLLQTATDGIHVLDETGQVIEVNQAFCQMLGYTREELLGLHVSDWDSQWSHEELLVKVREHLSQPALFETRHRRKDGEVRDVEINSTAVQLDGRIVLYASARDITDRKTQERELERQQRLNSLGVLAGGIAHDFNNILANLSLQAEMARTYLAAGKPDEGISKLEKLPAVFNRGKALTRQLLTFSKGGDPVMVAADLGPLLKDWVSMAMVGSNLEVEIQVDPRLWSCRCDVNQISQVVNNLLINARQATGDGGKVTLRASNYFRNGPYVAIEVNDTGQGIPEAIQPRLFDPFFTTKPNGTGLGLSISYSIIKKHSGWIKLDSKENEGSTFTCFLPASTTAEAPGTGEASKVLTVDGVVVVMDDDEGIRNTVAEMLVTMGFKVFQAENGQEVLKYLRRLQSNGEPTPLFLLDILVKGGMGGVETMGNIMSLCPTSKVVLMSGYFEESSRTSPELSCTFLAKPFTKEELFQALTT